MAGIYIKNLE